MGERRRPLSSRLGWPLAFAVMAAALGASLTASLLTNAPGELRAAERIDHLPVGHDLFDDARTVHLSVRRGVPAALSAPAAGRVTAFPCEPGLIVSSGASPFSLDGRPILALATASPLWRDLDLGATGGDVLAFQEELVRLGHPITVDGMLGRSTMAAAKAAFEHVGASAPSDVVPLAAIVWLPMPQAMVARCDVPTGSDIDEGVSMAAFGNAGLAATIDDPPADLVPGARVVVVGDERLPVDDAHVVLSERSPLASVADRDAGASGEGVEARLVLADPVEASVVPPSSVFGLDGSSGCVRSGDGVHRVRVLGSQLGETLVIFVGGRAPEQVATTPPRGAACA